MRLWLPTQWKPGKRWVCCKTQILWWRKGEVDLLDRVQAAVPEGEGDEDLPALPVLGGDLLAVPPLPPHAPQQLAPQVSLGGQGPTVSLPASIRDIN